MPHKIPVSVLVVIHTPDLHVLVMERADHPGFWQSVTGSCETLDEPLADTARREALEETGIDAAQHHLIDWGHHIEYEIYPRWRHRYAPGVTRERAPRRRGNRPPSPPNRVAGRRTSSWRRTGAR